MTVYGYHFGLALQVVYNIYLKLLCFVITGLQ